MNRIQIFFSVLLNKYWELRRNQILDENIAHDNIVWSQNPPFSCELWDFTQSILAILIPSSKIKNCD